MQKCAHKPINKGDNKWNQKRKSEKLLEKHMEM
jgi:hypothetical protein